MRTRLGGDTRAEANSERNESGSAVADGNLSFSLSLVYFRPRATRLIRRGFRIPDRSGSEMTEVTHHIFRERFGASRFAQRVNLIT